MNHLQSINADSSASPDRALIDDIVREVVRRLSSQPSDQSRQSESSRPRLVTLESLHGVDGTFSIGLQTVITPAAREEARRRGIEFVAPEPKIAEGPQESHSPEDPFVRQLTSRGITVPPRMEIFWTDHPASKVFERIRAGRRATLISRWGEVDRFGAELEPDTWVLDRKALTLSSAINLARRIIRRGTT